MSICISAKLMHTGGHAIDGLDRSSIQWSYVRGTSTNRSWAPPSVMPSIRPSLASQTARHLLRATKTCATRGQSCATKWIVARGFMALGIQKGQRVGISAPNRAEWAIHHPICDRPARSRIPHNSFWLRLYRGEPEGERTARLGMSMWVFISNFSFKEAYNKAPFFISPAKTLENKAGIPENMPT